LLPALALESLGSAASADTNALLPTDVTPIQGAQRYNVTENFQLNLLDKLPPRLYFSTTIDSNFRLETNPFQYPTKSVLLRQLIPQGTQFNQFTTAGQQSITKALSQSDRFSTGFRVTPNVTLGWALTPTTRVYANWFMLRDQLFQASQLNTVAHSISGGIQRTDILGKRTSVTSDVQFRQFFATHDQRFFDFLPSLTVQCALTRNSAIFANALLQLRGIHYFDAPTREIDPFYTVGYALTRGRWNFTASGTLVQNFRRPFHQNSLNVDSDSIITDYEIARRILPQLPGLQAYLRAEPIYNFHTHNRPGLAGMDFRLYWGMRLTAAKPAISPNMAQMIKQLKAQ
jgi:hypothetical protein